MEGAKIKFPVTFIPFLTDRCANQKPTFSLFITCFTYTQQNSQFHKCKIGLEIVVFFVDLVANVLLQRLDILRVVSGEYVREV